MPIGAGHRSHVPARRLLDVIASLAEALPVVEGRRTSAHTAHHMVMVPDWGIAVRRPAGLIAQIDQLGQSPGEQSASRLGLDQCTGGTAPVQPPHKNFSFGTDGFEMSAARRQPELARGR